MTTFRALLAASMLAATVGTAVAKLPPAPPMDDAAKAAAEAKKASEALTAEAAKKVQARAEDRVAARYIAEQKAKGVIVAPQMGPSSGGTSGDAAKGPSAKPEKAMAHSPAKK